MLVLLLLLLVAGGIGVMFLVGNDSNKTALIADAGGTVSELIDSGSTVVTNNQKRDAALPAYRDAALPKPTVKDAAVVNVPEVVGKINFKITSSPSGAKVYFKVNRKWKYQGKTPLIRQYVHSCTIWILCFWKNSMLAQTSTIPAFRMIQL